jgi:hypothetical protein
MLSREAFLKSILMIVIAMSCAFLSAEAYAKAICTGHNEYACGRDLAYCCGGKTHQSARTKQLLCGKPAVACTDGYRCTRGTCVKS